METVCHAVDIGRNFKASEIFSKICKAIEALGRASKRSEIDFEVAGANRACANRELIGEFAILEKDAI